MEIVDHPEMLAQQINALLSDPTVIQEVSTWRAQESRRSIRYLSTEGVNVLGATGTDVPGTRMSGTEVFRYQVFLS